MTMVEVLHGILELTYRTVLLCGTQRKQIRSERPHESHARSIALMHNNLIKASIIFAWEICTGFYTPVDDMAEIFTYKPTFDH